MKFSYDMHIHSCLSPCGDTDMTPNNIINMCYIKGLNIIAITDHNSMLNVESIMKLGLEKDILVIPGIEVTTKEEVHVCCYFYDLNDGIKFQDLIYDGLPDIKNSPLIFGNQEIRDMEDELINEVDKLLISSTKYSLDDINHMVKKYNGVMVPAHIDRKSFGMLAVLGFIPDGLDIYTVELSKYFQDQNNIFNTDLSKYNIIKNSDAHYLKDINESINFIDIEQLNINSVLTYLTDTGGIIA